MNWEEIIQDLLNAGMKQSFIASETGLSSSSIIDIKIGRQKSVKYEVGCKLVSLHKKLCSSKRVAA